MTDQIEVLETCPKCKVPEGWKLVPVQPTRQMLEEAGTVYAYDDMQMDARPDQDHIDWWKAMLSAASTPEEQDASEHYKG